MGATFAITESHRFTYSAAAGSIQCHLGYSKRRHILEIEFINGAIYRYSEVPVTIYRELMAADSKARFYDSNIRGHYRSVLIRSQQKVQATK